MNEIRSQISQTNVSRTGVLVLTSVVDLEALRKEYGESVPVDAITKAGVFEVALEKNGKSRTLFSAPNESGAVAFIEGFKACADVRKVQNRPKKRRAGGDA